MTKFYSYLLDKESLERPEDKVAGKLKDDRWGDMPARKDEDRTLPGKLKPFGGQGKEDEGINDKVSGKLKPFGGDGKGDDGRNDKVSGKLKQFGGKDKDDGRNDKVPGKLKLFCWKR